VRLPHGLPARRGVDAAERGVEQPRTLERRDLALPHVQINEMRTVARRKGGGCGQIGLRRVVDEVVRLLRDRLVEHADRPPGLYAGAVEGGCGVGPDAAVVLRQ
jgi:hypothetical protein